MTAELHLGVPPLMIELRSVTFLAPMVTKPWMSRPLITCPGLSKDWLPWTTFSCVPGGTPVLPGPGLPPGRAAGAVDFAALGPTDGDADAAADPDGDPPARAPAADGSADPVAPSPCGAASAVGRLAAPPVSRHPPTATVVPTRTSTSTPAPISTQRHRTGNRSPPRWLRGVSAVSSAPSDTAVTPLTERHRSPYRRLPAWGNRYAGTFIAARGLSPDRSARLDLPMNVAGARRMAT